MARAPRDSSSDRAPSGKNFLSSPFQVPGISRVVASFGPFSANLDSIGTTKAAQAMSFARGGRLSRTEIPPSRSSNEED